MSDTIHSQASVDSEQHSSKPLDETVWRGCLQKNLLQERRRAARRIIALNWVCIGVLVAAIAVSSYVSTPYVSTYQAVVRVAIGLGGTVLMFESLRTRQYISAASLAGIVVLFNPCFSSLRSFRKLANSFSEHASVRRGTDLDERANSGSQGVKCGPRAQEPNLLAPSALLFMVKLILQITLTNGVDFT